MRIIGGDKKGLILSPKMKGWPTRPTTDLAKEALYNILMNQIDFGKVSFLDLFGGSGSHSLEFLSRGCRDVTFVDDYEPCLRWMKTITSEWGYTDLCTFVKMNVFKYIKRTSRSFDIIFADPPYDLTELSSLPSLIFNQKLLNEEGLLIIEHDNNTEFINHISIVEERKYGKTRFSFFR